VSEEDNRLAGVVSLADLELAAAVSDKGADKTPVKAAARPALVVSPGTRVSDVARRMEHDHLECAVVLGEDDYVAGIFTITDALRALREAEAGRPVEPEVVPTHRVRVEASRKQVLPTTRVKRMLREHSASPSPNDGTALGKVFP
jgi:CBS domain-containing protein